MLKVLRQGLIGHTDVELHYERFSAPPVLDGKPFTVTCRVLDGEVDHRDRTLTATERAHGDMLICISRAGQLLLDA